MPSHEPGETAGPAMAPPLVGMDLYSRNSYASMHTFYSTRRRKGGASESLSDLLRTSAIVTSSAGWQMARLHVGQTLEVIFGGSALVRLEICIPIH